MNIHKVLDMFTVCEALIILNYLLNIIVGYINVIYKIIQLFIELFIIKLNNILNIISKSLNYSIQ